MSKVGRPIEGKNGSKASNLSISLYPTHIEQLEFLRKKYNLSKNSEVIQMLIETSMASDVLPIIIKETSVVKNNDDKDKFIQMFKKVVSTEKSTVADTPIELSKNFLKNSPRTKELFPGMEIEDIYNELIKSIEG